MCAYLLRIFPYSVRIWENTYQKNSKYRHFSHSAWERVSVISSQLKLTMITSNSIFLSQVDALLGSLATSSTSFNMYRVNPNSFKWNMEEEFGINGETSLYFLLKAEHILWEAVMIVICNCICFLHFEIFFITRVTNKSNLELKWIKRLLKPLSLFTIF